MKSFLIAVALALLATATADVSHLARTYLPPQTSISTQPVQSYLPPVQTYMPPVQQTYSAPLVSNVVQSIPISTYTAPALSYAVPIEAERTISISHGHGHGHGHGQGHGHGHGQGNGQNNGQSQGQNHGQGQGQNHGQGYEYGHGQGQNTAPALEYLPPVQQTYGAPQSHVQVQQTYSAPVSYQVPAIKYTTAIASSPHSYSAPAVQQTYSAPDISSFSISNSNDDVGTQYAANGGYIYK